VGQEQRPEAQRLPIGQAAPQLPQLLMSELVSTHEFVQSEPDVQRIPHAKPSHVAKPLPDCGSGQVEPQLRNPHEVRAVLLTQVPLQSCVPNGQVHSPAVQT
jgi:hypothetical protein